MLGLTLDEVRARHAGLVAQRQKEQATFKERDTGFSFVLGELEQMIAELERREKEAADLAAAAQLDAERLAAEELLLSLAEPEAGAEC